MVRNLGRRQVSGRAGVVSVSGIAHVQDARPVLLSRYRAYELCAVCHGARLNPTALSYRVGQKTWPSGTPIRWPRRWNGCRGFRPRSSQNKLVIESLHSRLGFCRRSVWAICSSTGRRARCREEAQRASDDSTRCRADGDAVCSG